MSKIIVLYNSKSGNGRGEASAKNVVTFYPNDELEFHDITKEKQADIIANTEGTLLICGGDGTLNRFANEIEVEKLDRDIYFYSAGTGNDFINDLGRKPEEGPVKVNQYLVNLPVCTVKGKKYKFINGIGYGIDGYCCEEGDRIRAKSSKPVNYTTIAIKGLLFKYKPTSAKVTVDGVTKEYKKVWLSPTMNGRFFGGGMMPTPNQPRLEEDKKVSNLVFHDTGKIQTLMIFPKIFKGEHLKHTAKAEVRRGKHVRVEFDRAVALQVDGETILDVTSYEVDI